MHVARRRWRRARLRKSHLIWCATRRARWRVLRRLLILRLPRARRLAAAIEQQIGRRRWRLPRLLVLSTKLVVVVGFAPLANNDDDEDDEQHQNEKRCAADGAELPVLETQQQTSAGRIHCAKHHGVERIASVAGRPIRVVAHRRWQRAALLTVAHKALLARSWRQSRWNARTAGIAGLATAYKHLDARIVVRVAGRRLVAHKLAHT